MKSVKVKSCEACPFFIMDENWNCICRLDKLVKMEKDEISKVNEKCPLKQDTIEVSLHVERPSVFLFHAKKPNFGFGDPIEFNEDNYEMVATAFTDESTDMSNTDMILEWMFERTNSIETSWTQNKYPEGKSRIVPIGEKCRSTSVGDVVIIRNKEVDTYWRCGMAGWEEVNDVEYRCADCEDIAFPNGEHFEHNKYCNCE